MNDIVNFLEHFPPVLFFYLAIVLLFYPVLRKRMGKFTFITLLAITIIIDICVAAFKC